MLFVIVYCGAAIYIFLTVFGVIHKGFAKKLDPPRRFGILIMGSGLMVLGLYYAYHTYYFSTEDGKKLQQMQKQMQRDYFPR